MKLKLEIQRFNSTNQTTHYDLSQYTANDKPTYLIDYNGDMAKIDTAIYGADARSLVNATSIGDLTTLETTAKSNLVSAVNEIKSATDTNTSNISTNTSNIGTLGTNQGVMANLTTTEKSSLVGAINEVDAENTTQNTAILNLQNLFKLNTNETIANNTITTNIGNVDQNNTKVRVAKNNDGSVFKLYGYIQLRGLQDSGTPSGNKTIVIPTSLRPTEEFTITAGAFLITQCRGYFGTFNEYPLRSARGVDITFKTNGNVEIELLALANDGREGNIYLPPCIYFNTNFGD